MIIGLHVGLNGHETTMSKSPSKIMHKLLGKKHVASDVLTTNKHPLLDANQLGENQLQLTNHNLRHCLV